MPVNLFSDIINNNVNLSDELDIFIGQQVNHINNDIIPPTPDNIRSNISDFLNLNGLPNDNNVVDLVVGIVEAQIQALIVPDEDSDAGPGPGPSPG